LKVKRALAEKLQEVGGCSELPLKMGIESEHGENLVGVAGGLQ
jgi:hypothetical protein